MRLIADLPLHEEVYEFLRINRLVKNKADFCRDFMGMSRTYLNTLRYSSARPSQEAYRNLLTSLSSIEGASNLNETIREYREAVQSVLA